MGNGLGTFVCLPFFLAYKQAELFWLPCLAVGGTKAVVVDATRATTATRDLNCVMVMMMPIVGRVVIARMEFYLDIKK